MVQCSVRVHASKQCMMCMKCRKEADMSTHGVIDRGNHGQVGLVRVLESSAA